MLENGNTDAVRTWLSRSQRTWASSVGGPGLNFGEHMAGRSRLGTILTKPVKK